MMTIFNANVGDGVKFIACGSYVSKTFKTLKGAIRFCERNGYKYTVSMNDL